MIKSTIVIPVYNEGKNIINTLTAIKNEVKSEYKITVVYDSEEDTTLPALDEAEKNLNIKVTRLRNKYGCGALNAIKSGLESAETEYVIVTMADLSDPPAVIDDMICKADETNADIVCGSRYMKGGSQTRGPKLKSFMSKMAGLSLHYLAGLPVHDATNSFKLYRKSFIEKMTIESKGGFELGMELVVKAWQQGYKTAEVPTSWTDRTDGKSNFKLWQWLPSYLHWYFAALSSNPASDVSCNKNNRFKSIASWFILFMAMCWNFYNVSKYALDIPFWDEWDYIKILDNFSWENITAVHVQHRIIFSRLLFYIGYWLNGLDFRQMIIFNWFLYIAVVLSTMRLFWKNLKNIPYFPLFFLPFFSDLASENLLWAGQSQFHLMLLFLMTAAYYGFVAEDSLKSRILFCIFMILSMYSMSPSPALIFLGTWCLKTGINKYKAGQTKKTIILSILPVIIATAIAMGGFFIDYHPMELTGIKNIWHIICCFGASAGRIIGFLSIEMNPVLWIIILLCSIIPLCLFFISIAVCRENIITENGAATAVILWCGAFIFIIGYARNAYIADRHMEAVLAFTPALASILAMLPNRFMRKNFLKMYLVFMIFALSFSFSFKKASVRYHERKTGMEILLRWHDRNKDKNDLKIPYLYPHDFSEQAKNAERLDLSYLKKHKKTTSE